MDQNNPLFSFNRKPKEKRAQFSQEPFSASVQKETGKLIPDGWSSDAFGEPRGM